MEFALIIDSREHSEAKHNASIALIEALQELGHEVWITQAHQLGVIEGRAFALLQPVRLVPVELQNRKGDAVNFWLEVGQCVQRFLDEMEAVFIQHETIYTLQFSEVIIESIICQKVQRIWEYVEQQTPMILKFRDNNSAQGILPLEPEDHNFKSIAIDAEASLREAGLLPMTSVVLN
jgi:glutathione synthase